MNRDLMIQEPTTLADTLTLGKVLAESGFFSDSRSASQAVVKVLAGRELGFGSIASMTGINIISGRVSLSANLIAAAVKRSGKYNYKVAELTDAICRIEFFEQSKSVGISTFTVADAAKADTKNMNKFPRNMLFARAISNGAKWYCADIFGGPVYTPEELGADVDEDGNMIESTARQVPPPFGNGGKQPATLPARAANDGLPAGEGDAPDTVDADFDAIPGAQDEAPLTAHQRKTMFAVANEVYGKELIAEFRTWIHDNYNVNSSNDLTMRQADEIIAKLRAQLAPALSGK